jgi:hypothetical protein
MNERLEKIRQLLSELEDEMKTGVASVEIVISPRWNCRLSFRRSLTIYSPF